MSVRRRAVISLAGAAVLCAAAAGSLWAGPPFTTDDPEPVELHHWEVYVGTMEGSDPTGRTGTLPHVEVNYGSAPDVQLHLIVPCAFSEPSGGTLTRGIGDLELGVKDRFVQETAHRPMIGTFPQLEVPTGSAGRGLGGGHLRVFLPIWLQKSWGPWTSYGGGGYWVNPGPGNRDYWFTGALLQRDFGERWTLGAEVFRTTPTGVGSRGQLFTNVGGQYNLDEGHHILFSVGRSFHGDEGKAVYLAHQWTFGPHEAPAPAAK